MSRCASADSLQTGCYVTGLSLVFSISEQEGRMPANFGWLRFGAVSVVIAASTLSATPARATDVVTEWSTIHAAGADLEAGHDRTQDHGAVPAGLHARKLRPASALRRRAPDHQGAA